MSFGRVIIMVIRATKNLTSSRRSIINLLSAFKIYEWEITVTIFLTFFSRISPLLRTAIHIKILERFPNYLEACLYLSANRHISTAFN